MLGLQTSEKWQLLMLFFGSFLDVLTTHSIAIGTNAFRDILKRYWTSYGYIECPFDELAASDGTVCCAARNGDMWWEMA